MKEIAPIAFGASLAGLIKSLDLPTESLVVPSMLQLGQRFNPYFTKETKPSLSRDVWNISKYAIGAMLPYAPEIYQNFKELI